MALTSMKSTAAKSLKTSSVLTMVSTFKTSAASQLSTVTGLEEMQVEVEEARSHRARGMGKPHSWHSATPLRPPPRPQPLQALGLPALQETNGVSSTGKVPVALRPFRERERPRWPHTLANDRFEVVHEDGRDVEDLEEVPVSEQPSQEVSEGQPAFPKEMTEVTVSNSARRQNVCRRDRTCRHGQRLATETLPGSLLTAF
jgi:hypothetical protein